MDKEIDNYVFRGVLQNDLLNQVLRSLCMTSPLSHQLVEHKLMDDGTYRKGKVLL